MAVAWEVKPVDHLTYPPEHLVSANISRELGAPMGVLEVPGGKPDLRKTRT